MSKMWPLFSSGLKSSWSDSLRQDIMQHCSEVAAQPLHFELQGLGFTPALPPSHPGEPLDHLRSSLVLFFRLDDEERVLDDWLHIVQIQS